MGGHLVIPGIRDDSMMGDEQGYWPLMLLTLGVAALLLFLLAQ